MGDQMDQIRKTGLHTGFTTGTGLPRRVETDTPGGGFICLRETGVYLTVGYTGVHTQTFGEKMDH